MSWTSLQRIPNIPAIYVLFLWASVYLGKAVGSELMAGKTVQSSVGDRAGKEVSGLQRSLPVQGAKLVN